MMIKWLKRQMDRYTTDSFIKRALEIHGDRYI